MGVATSFRDRRTACADRNGAELDIQACSQCKYEVTLQTHLADEWHSINTQLKLGPACSATGNTCSPHNNKDALQSQSLEQQRLLPSSTRWMPVRSKESRRRLQNDMTHHRVMWREWGRGYWQSSIIFRLSGRISDTWCGEKAMYSYFYSTMADPPWPAHARRNAMQKAGKGA